MVMGRNGYGPILSWAEMVMGRNDQLPLITIKHRLMIYGRPTCTRTYLHNALTYILGREAQRLLVSDRKKIAIVQRFKSIKLKPVSKKRMIG